MQGVRLDEFQIPQAAGNASFSNDFVSNASADWLSAEVNEQSSGGRNLIRRFCRGGGPGYYHSGGIYHGSAARVSTVGCVRLYSFLHSHVQSGKPEKCYNGTHISSLFGGLPYPRWRHDPKIAEDYKALAGLADVKTTHMAELTERIFQRR